MSQQIANLDYYPENTFDDNGNRWVLKGTTSGEQLKYKSVNVSSGTGAEIPFEVYIPFITELKDQWLSEILKNFHNIYEMFNLNMTEDMEITPSINQWNIEGIDSSLIELISRQFINEVTNLPIDEFNLSIEDGSLIIYGICDRLDSNQADEFYEKALAFKDKYPKINIRVSLVELRGKSKEQISSMKSGLLVNA